MLSSKAIAGPQRLQLRLPTVRSTGIRRVVVCRGSGR